eukprot:scaffold43845_cov34-Phaeocystis_antarctica.AAC.1
MAARQTIDTPGSSSYLLWYHCPSLRPLLLEPYRRPTGLAVLDLALRAAFADATGGASARGGGVRARSCPPSSSSSSECAGPLRRRS